MSRIVKIGKISIGGGNPIAIQSMTNTDTRDTKATLEQINALYRAGCDLVRVSIPDFESLDAFAAIVKCSPVPLIADIHYDYRLAIGAIEKGASKVRINPGNIGQSWKVREIVSAAKDYGIPIRVGANSGSIKESFKAYETKAIALAESALEETHILESLGFYDIVISAKSSSVIETIEANKYISSKVDYPLHIGVTEAGIFETAVVKSSVGIGTLLLEGIGDTIRVSIAGDPLTEVRIAKKLLKSLNLREGVEVIACPTCARTEIDVESLAYDVENWLEGLDKNLTVAVMGCVVNGIGEGKDADIGIAGTASGAVIFTKGEIVKRVKKDILKRDFLKLVKEYLRKN
ncbi:4-hydroxy-3-methylbut-2-en-1-yl diphosphate synthase [Kosmotoga arenicorallina S304]|uniref:4-hydroxy-3-methylbut-2-en-1-yl diphosphate synthase (flavodoxin) n=1 Tax=Kosmotoga arenicorallina S304 TaxID=1453497 RepID=A0A176K1F6_9BACT|nr:flavodoxin-dependent (E)-4-hydroxy-3-methylbut-2-enyl-diphosphate synthase [Kosmotoga arenicorallina]OAA30978.1 4-hydroxy-3-methylbut-2-en-1-yl diphosphate synthase [Kosmotoga arenicorallina S304]